MAKCFPTTITVGQIWTICQVFLLELPIFPSDIMVLWQIDKKMLTIQVWFDYHDDDIHSAWTIQWMARQPCISICPLCWFPLTNEWMSEWLSYLLLKINPGNTIPFHSNKLHILPYPAKMNDWFNVERDSSIVSGCFENDSLCLAVDCWWWSTNEIKWTGRLCERIKQINTTITIVIRYMRDDDDHHFHDH